MPGWSRRSPPTDRAAGFEPRSPGIDMKKGGPPGPPFFRSSTFDSPTLRPPSCLPGRVEADSVGDGLPEEEGDGEDHDGDVHGNGSCGLRRMGVSSDSIRQFAPPVQCFRAPAAVFHPPRRSKNGAWRKKAGKILRPGNVPRCRPRPSPCRPPGRAPDGARAPGSWPRRVLPPTIHCIQMVI